MDHLTIILIEVVSATLCFILVRFMVKPYLYTGDDRYVGLPLGFAFLGMSYLFTGLASSLDNIPFAEEMRWLKLFTQTYAFAFLALTYYFSKKPLERNVRLWWQLIFSGIIALMVFSYLIVIGPQLFALPGHRVADEYFKVFNIFCVSYISLHTLRSHAFNREARTMLVPLGYILLAFGQYSSLIMSFDPNFLAFAGGHILRIAGLSVFLFIAYKAFGAQSDVTSMAKGLK